jgi:predicted nucleic acid-binding protein
MRDRTFVDTNVLIYAHDVDAKTKHEVAKRILRELWNQRTGVLSMQVLQEFYVNVTRKIASPLPKATRGWW